MTVGLLAVPLFLLCHRFEWDTAQLVVGCFGAIIAMFWAPLNTYVGLRVGERIEWMCALVAFIPCPFWIWWCVTH